MYIIHFFVLLLVKYVSTVDNNVCPTFRDYMNMKVNKNCWYNFAADLKVPDIIKRTGYPFMEYKVQTKDGYILTMFRIPSVTSGREAVFMLHGVQSTSGIFVGLGRNSLAFMLADAGYDVWLGNYRGNEYSEGHTSLNVTMRDYWNYGVDEIALIDVPTMLQAVSYHSGNKGKIIYIGHSLGTTAALMYASEYPDHAKNTVKAFIWICPAYTLTHMRSPYRAMFPLMRTALGLSNNLNVVQILSRGYSRRITRPTCLASPALMLMCFNALNMFVGPFQQMAPETIPVLFNQFPGGTSLKTLLYLAEAVRGNFRKFDYGGRNMLMYGTEVPPTYNISKVQVPVILFYSRGDWATTKADALNLYQKLPQEVRYGTHEVRRFNFNHFDFVFGRDARRLVYDRLLMMLQGISSG